MLTYGRGRWAFSQVCLGITLDVGEKVALGVPISCSFVMWCVVMSCDIARYDWKPFISTVFLSVSFHSFRTELTLLASNFGLVSNPSWATIVDIVMDSFSYWVPINLGFIPKITLDYSYFLNLFFCAVSMKVTVWHTHFALVHSNN